MELVHELGTVRNRSCPYCSLANGVICVFYQLMYRQQLIQSIPHVSTYPICPNMTAYGAEYSQQTIEPVVEKEQKLSG